MQAAVNDSGLQCVEPDKLPILQKCFIDLEAMQCNAMQCNAMQCNAMQCNAMQCNAMQCNAMQCNAMQCNAMQCNTIHHHRAVGREATKTASIT